MLSRSVLSNSWDPMDHSLPGSPVHGISEARLLQWVAISCSRGSSWSKERTYVSCTGRQSIFWFLLFSHSVMSHSLQPHGQQHAKLPYPSLPPGACSNSCSLSRWYHSTISSFVVPFSSCPQSFPASGSFLMSQLFASGGQSIGISASASVLPMNIQSWFPLGLTSLISLRSKGLARVFSSTTVWKHQFFSTQPSLWSNSHIRTWLLEKPQLWPYGPLLAKWCLCFLIHCLVFLPRNKRLLISWLQAPSSLILEP